MTKMFLKFLCLVGFSIALTGCFSDTFLYNKKITGHFTNSNFEFYKNKYPLVIDAKGISDSKIRKTLINVMIEEYENHHRFNNANLVSAMSFNEKVEVSYVIAVNTDLSQSSRNLCAENSTIKSVSEDLNSITNTQIAFCRDETALSFITSEFTTPVSVKSDKFRKAISLAASSILYRYRNPINGCISVSPSC